MDMGSLIAPFVGPVSSAAIAFPVAASVLVVPFALYHYRKHGRVHPWRAFVSYSFVYYMIAALFLVILPLPERPVGAEAVEAWSEMYGELSTPRLDPTGFVRDLLAAPNRVERYRALAQIVFNILLIVPFGAYMAYSFRRPLYVVPLLGLLLSLFYEICQLTGNFGWYPGPYRLFDAGDLVLNTVGALAGGALARLLQRLGVLPRLDTLKGPTDPWIRPFRRLVANALDLLALGLAALGLSVVLDLVAPTGAAVKGAVSAGVALALLVVLPAVDRGRGLGKRLCLTAVRRTDGRPAPVVLVLARQAALWIMPAAAYLAVSIDPRLGRSIPAAGMFLIWLAVWVLNTLKAAFDNEHASYLDRWMDLRVRDTWTEAHPPRKKAPRRRAARRS